MKYTFDKGLAFICEGDTEKEFYLSLLEYLCHKYGTQLEKQEPVDTADVIYIIPLSNGHILVKFHCVNTISGFPKAGKWFEAECHKKYQVQNGWDVLLCYDTDNHNDEISQFHEGDWKLLRDKLASSKQVIDLAANADIEDVLLIDLQGICQFLGGTITVQPDELIGRKGCAKMKWLYRRFGQHYHKGKRARSMIDSLDMQKIIDSDIIPLSQLERLFN